MEGSKTKREMEGNGYVIGGLITINCEDCFAPYFMRRACLCVQTAALNVASNADTQVRDFFLYNRPKKTTMFCVPNKQTNHFHVEAIMDSSVLFSDMGLRAYATVD